MDSFNINEDKEKCIIHMIEFEKVFAWFQFKNSKLVFQRNSAPTFGREQGSPQTESIVNRLCPFRFHFSTTSNDKK